MVNVFEIAVERLNELGFYNFLLPFILFTAIVFAVLRKTHILGDSVSINAVVAVSAGLLVLGAPVLLGGDLIHPLTAFMTQSLVVMLVIIVGFMLASFFYPNITEKLGEIFKAPGPANWLIWGTVALAAVFGLFTFIGKPIGTAISGAKIPSELISMVVIVFIVMIILLVVTIGAGKEAK